MINMNIEEPLGGACVSNSITTTGWAVSDDGIEKIEILLDNNFVCNATKGFERPDVERAFPGTKDSLYSGFRANLDCTEITDGKHKLTVRFMDSRGRNKEQDIMFFIKKDLCNSELIEDICPWCGSNEVMRVPHSNVNDYNLVICNRCQTGFIHPIPTEEKLEQYYSNIYWENKIDYSADATHYDTEYINRLIKKYSPETKSVLEIGCGGGLLLNGLKKLGYEVSGQDLSKESARKVKEIFDIEVINSPLSKITQTNLDCVILRHVLEHSITPKTDLENIMQRLSEDGIAIIITPNMQSITSKILGTLWEWYIPPIHAFYFSQNSFKNFYCDILHFETRSGDALTKKTCAKICCERNKELNACFPEEYKLKWEKAFNNLFVEQQELCNSLGLGEELVLVLKRR